MSQPRVSIVTPFWNAARFLDEAIASVFAQTYSDWELLLVDDGSTDESVATARAYAERHPEKIRYLEHSQHQNRGISASINLGVVRSVGGYVAVLDSDDVWLPGKLEEQVAILDRDPELVLVYGPSQYWYSWSGRLEDRPRDRVVKLGVPADRTIEPPELLTRMLRHDAPVPCPSSLLLRRSAFDRVGGFEESFRSNHTDQAFYAKLFLSERVFASSKCWVRYRKHEDSSIARLRRAGKGEGERRVYLEWLRGYLLERGQEGGEPWKVLETELFPLRHPVRARLRRVAREPIRSAWRVVERITPSPAARKAMRRLLTARRRDRPVGLVRFGDFRRLHPFSRRWGFDRGLPVDRYYIEAFLERHSADIRGRVMEIGDDACTWRFGRDAVTHSDVLNVAPGDPKTTLVGDLAAGDPLPSERFDCIIFTETLHLLYDFRAGLRTLYRMLKPGGVLLATFPGITRIGPPDDWGTSWYWSFTPLSARRVFDEVFPAEGSAIEAWGNLLAATAFLWGLAAEELTAKELDQKDPEYPVTLTVKAVRPIARLEERDGPS